MKYFIRLILLYFFVFSLTFFQVSAESDVLLQLNTSDGELLMYFVDSSEEFILDPSIIEFQEYKSTFSPIDVEGTFGTSEQKLRIDNATGGEVELSLALDVSDFENDAKWVDGEKSFSAYSTDGLEGGLLVDTSEILLMDDDCGGVTNDRMPSRFTFIESLHENNLESIDVLNTNGGEYCRFDLTNLKLIQTVPPRTPAGSYTLGIVLTLTAGGTPGEWWGGSFLFGSNPQLLDGVDFHDGTSMSGMIVFKTPGVYEITPESDGYVEILVVAGGGGGGRKNDGSIVGAGGGGAGGLLHETMYSISTDSISVVVGDGGIGGIVGVNHSANGEDSVFGAYTALGGGGGGVSTKTGSNKGADGGSGGGGRWESIGGKGEIGPPRQGYDGTGYDATNQNGGGGGGYSSNATPNATNSAGSGGDGIEKFGFVYAGGGGGGAFGTNAFGLGGLGGGGDGGNNTANGGNGSLYTGGGGGGAGGGPSGSANGGKGGSGIVIVRWGGYNKNYNPVNNSVW
jgi:hypothetical protein